MNWYKKAKLDKEGKWLRDNFFLMSIIKWCKKNQVFDSTFIQEIEGLVRHQNKMNKSKAMALLLEEAKKNQVTIKDQSTMQEIATGAMPWMDFIPFAQ